jgi:hypothetical protein
VDPELIVNCVRPERALKMFLSWRDPAHDSGHEHDRKRKYFLQTWDSARSFRAAISCLVLAVVWLDSVGRPESFGEDLEVADAYNV